MKPPRLRRRRKRSKPKPSHAIIVAGAIVILGLYIRLLRSALFPPTTSEPNEQPEKLFSNDAVVPPKAPDSDPKERSLSPLGDYDREFYTVRINSWERPEQLAVSVEHHSLCPGVAQVQVVWCQDQKGEPPEEVVENPKVVIEKHVVNSLNERFNVLVPTMTMGILSIDDDVLRPCEAIDSGFLKWTQNPDRMVGFDARSHVEKDGKWQYAYLSTTEKSNRYSLSLTRYCFLHRDYLTWYMNFLPKPAFQMVEKHFNCEDIAMSFFISSMTGGQPPLLADFWAIKSMIKLYSKSKISGTKSHKKLRDTCVDTFANLLGLKQSIKLAEIRHRKSRLFECGAKGHKAKLRKRKIERLQALEEKLTRWQHSGFKTMQNDLSRMTSEASRVAYERGFVEKTGPWKIKFGKH